MKILHYIPTLDRNSGGLASYMQLLSKDLGKLAELHIVTHKSENLVNIQNASLHFIDGKLTHLLKAKQEFIALLNELQPDIVHINCCWYPQCALIQKYSQQLGYKVCLSPHGMLEPWILKKNKWTKKIPALLLYQRQAIKKADIIIATSKNEKSNILSLKLNKNVTIIPNGIIVDGIECKKSWKKNKIILFLALLRPNKGAHLLIEAAAKLKPLLYDWKIIIAGKDDEKYENYLKSLVKSYKLDNIISFPGPLYDQKKWDMFRKSDIFILPTLNENFGIVIAESLLCGTPVITCKGAPWSSLNEENCGWWIERDLQQIIYSLKNAIGLSEQELKSMGINGRHYIINNYDSKIISKKIIDLYSSLSK